MTSKLIVFSGPSANREALLDGKRFLIGRGQSNNLRLNDSLVSREHASIVAKDGQFEINDLDAANGTMVNDVPIKRRELQHGDRITIGSSQLLFLLGDAEAVALAGPAQLDNGEITIGLSTVLQPEDTLYLQVEKVLATIPHSDRMARDLSALLKISVALNSIRQSEQFLQRLLELIFEVIPAERGAVLLTAENQVDFVVSASLDRELGTNQQFKVSRTVVQRVLRECVAVLCSDVSESETLGAIPSLTESQTHSLLATPLSVFEKMFGVVYLTTQDSTTRFCEDHQQLLTAIASIAAVTLENIRRMERLEDELQHQQSAMREMIGESAAMQKVKQFITKVAPANAKILILGESGTGKEGVAHAIHEQSLRKSKPFKAFNCATINQGVVESTLFGHKKGAFTGAIKDQTGLFEDANGGTLFLDEVGDLAPEVQSKLLRVLQEGKIVRLGETKEIDVDVRVLAATNIDLEAKIKDGKFREELYHRLNVISIKIPPLRERREDILLLARYFLKKDCEKEGRLIHGFSEDAKRCLVSYDWPGGNVRELQNAVEHAVVMCDGDFIHAHDLPERIREMEAPPSDSGLNLTQAIIKTKKQLILQAIEEEKGNLAAAAKLLGRDAANLHRMIRDLGMETEVEKLILRLKKQAPPKE